MTASPFLTRIESYRDPQPLWPWAAGLSGLAHGILLLSLHPWIQVTPSAADSPQAVPIQLLPPASVPSSAASATSTEPPPEAIPSLTQPATEAAAPSPDLFPAVPPNQNPADPQATTPDSAGDQGSPSPIPSSTPSPDSPPPPGNPNPPSIANSNPAQNPSGVTPPPPLAPYPSVDSSPQRPIPQPAPISPTTPAPMPGVAPAPNPVPHPAPNPELAPPSPAGGQLLPLGISATPYGSDWPDTPPQLLSTTEIAMTPWLAGCGIADLGLIASPGTTVRMQIRVRVEADGTISATYVDASSGNPALDNLVSCIGQRHLRLTPATVGGQPTITDAYQIEVQMQF